MVEWTGFGDGVMSPDSVAGAGPVESLFQTIESLSRVGDKDVAAIAVNGGALALDVLGAALGTAGIGWLIEHVSFLREPLDYLAGNGNRIKAAVGTWNETGAVRDEIAQAQHDAVGAQVSGWQQQAAEEFRASQKRLVDETLALSGSCVSVAGEIATAGTIRGTIRDLIAMFVCEVVRNAVIALASSVVSMGGSIAAFTAWAVGRGAVVLGRALKGLARSGKKAGGVRRRRAHHAFRGWTALARAWTTSASALVDRGTTAPSLSDVAAKAKQGGQEFADAYSPFKPITRADGGVSPHSAPSFNDGAFQIKFVADNLREIAKQDELEAEGVGEEFAGKGVEKSVQFERKTGYLDE
ncbi:MULTISPECIES: hypothetical protein [Actinosynnema]|uniref:hypothetical protein n=1 Tax=Actinosynnema TaxID=40566 RepID=UPI0020A2EDB5|nr:hypothetical protein [Actinosynnema pretiosum]MCP2097926.1 hypothetical protein [Actinosynnema pretiosum]